MSKEDLKYLTDEESEALTEKTKEFREAIEAAKKDAQNESAYLRMLVVFGELRTLYESFVYGRQFHDRLSRM